MRKQELPVQDSMQNVVELLGEAPAVLSGEGKALRGTVRVRNPGAERISLREASLRLQPQGSDQLAAFGQASFSLPLQPGQTARVRLSFDYDPLTPPGEYPGELEINGSIQKVIAYLAEVVRLTISPATVVLDQASGTAVRRIVFRNDGNVPLTIGPARRVQLGKELLLRRGFSATIAAVGEKTVDGLEKLVADFVRDESKAVFSEAGLLEVRLKGGSLLLQPGEARAVEMEIRMPEKLEANARYIGRAPLYTSDLEFVIVPPVVERDKRVGANKKAEE